MNKLFSNFFLALLYFIQNTIEVTSSKSTKASSKDMQLQLNVDCSKIKYYFDKTVFEGYRKYVEKTLGIIQNKTFLKFEKEEKLIYGVGIIFYSNDKEDKVELSYGNKKPTKVNLTDSAYVNRDLLRFYIGYALGLIPEITRRDRDFAVKVFDDKILPSYKKYYDKNESYPDIYYSTDFDVSSAMVAKFYFGSKPGVPKPPAYATKFSPHYDLQIRDSEKFSFNDYKRLNSLYCKDQCKNKQECANYGYYGNSCDKCRCVFPFAGNDCKSLYRRPEECSKNITTIANSRKKLWKLKNVSKKCYYIIKSSDSSKKIKFSIKRLVVKKPGSCEILIKYRKDKGAEGISIRKDVKDFSLPALSNSVIVTYFSSDSNNELVIGYQEVSK
uniref:Astacin domain-containing protein n=1 Tax=Strongyloides papillosus TaxID=174720 RepID=A0A0N5B5U8_STREA